jgi:hypothetical protein
MKSDLKRLLAKSSSYSSSSSSSIWFLQPREVWCVRNEPMGNSLISGKNGFEDEDDNEYEDEKKL